MEKDLIVDFLVLVSPLIVAFVLIVLLIIFWVILKKKYTATPSDSSKNKPLLFGCGSLIVSFACLVTIPYTFLITLGAGMSGDVSEPGVAIIIIGLFLSVGITIIAGVVGIIGLIAWAIKKFKSEPT